MMQTLDSLRRQIESTESLHSVVRTMKILSLTSIHQYEEAVTSLADYYRTIELGLQVVLKNRPAGIQMGAPSEKQHLGVLVFGSAQGLCGRFNEQIAAFAARQIEAWAPREQTVLALGELVVPYLEAVGHMPDRHVAVPESIGAITARVHELVVDIEAWHSEDHIDHVVLLYNRLHSGTSFEPHHQRLLPLDRDWLDTLQAQEWPTRMLPTFTMAWDPLFVALLRQYFFVSLYRAFAESQASEHASRLTSMQMAEDNIEERLSDLEARYHRQRQRAITEELLDITSGFEALTAQR